jgi:3-deoxy-7-phosphoheptulonate synthase
LEDLEVNKMVLVLEEGVSEGEIRKICEVISSMGLESKVVHGKEMYTISLIGDESNKPIMNLADLPGVKSVMPVQKPYKLVSRDGNPLYNHNGTKVVDIKVVKFGGINPVIIAGPCAVESLEQTLEIADEIKLLGVDMLRGGAYKPRTSPYEFQGLGEEGLRILKFASEKTNLPVVTEVTSPHLVEKVCEYADALQVGTRNMANYDLLREVGKSKKPVLLKRGMSATMKEWLCAAEYIAIEGNSDIILCVRGIKNNLSSEYGRNQADFDIIYDLRKETYFPVIADPSHIGGHRDRVPGLAMSALASGAQGLIIEAITEKASANTVLCDYNQSLRPSQIKDLLVRIRSTHN